MIYTWVDILKVVAAVPTYNSSSSASLVKLVSQLASQGFHKIYVIDDASIKDPPKFKQYKNVTVVKGNKNLGPTGNRNRVLNYDVGDVLFFCDDDMMLNTLDVPQTLDALFTKNTSLGVLGGRISGNNSKPLNFNFDCENNPLFRWIENTIKRKPMTPPDDYFDKPYMKVCWVLEGLFAIRSDVFQKIHGFDDGFKRYAEGGDLCRRVRDLGYTVYITNALQTTHTRPLSIIRSRRSHVFKYVRSGFRWYWKYNPLSNRMNGRTGSDGFRIQQE